MTQLEDYPLPRSIDAEMAVLGSVLLDNSALDRITGELSPSAFNLDCHWQIYDAMTALHRQGKPIDLLTLEEELQARGRLESCGGLLYLMNLMDAPSTAVNAPFYAKTVSEKYELRRFAALGAQIHGAALDPSADPAAILEKIEVSLQQILSERAGNTIQPIRAVVEERLDALEERYSNKFSSGHKTPYEEYNWITQGLHPDELTIIAGRPGLGKSALMMQLAVHHAQKHGAVAIFSLEMSAGLLVDRLFSTGARVDSHHIRTGNMHPADWQQIGAFAAELRDLPMFIDDSATLSIHELRSRARRLHAQTPLSLICVDYLQMLSGGAGKQNRVTEIGEVARGLKLLARDLSLPVIALAQLSRALESRPDKTPQLSDLRESGQIEQDADVVSFLFRESMYAKKKSDAEEDPYAEPGPDKAQWIVAKQRNGPTGTAELQWTGKFTRFDDVTKHYDDDQYRAPYNEN